MHLEKPGTTTSPRDMNEDDLIAVLDSGAIEEGRQAAHDRSHIGALTNEPGEVETGKPVTPEVVAARLAVAIEARERLMDDLAVVQGKILGLREIVTPVEALRT